MQAAIRHRVERFWQWFSPPVPLSVRDPLRKAQLDNVRGQVPMLLSVAALNVMLVMAVCANNGLPLRNYGWMAALIVYCALRIYVWKKRLSRPVTVDKIPSIIKMNVGLSLGMMAVLGVVTSITFVAGTFAYETLIPVSLAFGATAIAHCLYTLRPAAIGVLVCGITPVAAALIFAGDFNAVMLGLSMLSVEVLMIRFVAAQYDRLIEGLFLEKQIRELAETDPLTGLANRRAIMAALDDEMAIAEGGDSRFGLALLDLDGFKQVNDRLGHHAGDSMLLAVGARLSAAAPASDSVGRLGGDEFIVIFRDVADKADLAMLTTHLLAALCRPLDLDGHPVPVAASLGYALFPEDGDSIREVMHFADVALYAEKRAGAGSDRSAAAPDFDAANAPARPALQFRP